MKKYLWIVALLAALTLVFVGCGGGSTPPTPPPDETPFVHEFTGDEVRTWGTNAPTIDEDGFINVTASSSSGFYIRFEDIEYTYSAADTLIFTYEIEVTTPEAVVTGKNPDNWSGDFGGDSAWGVGKGREYVLGNETMSNYEGPTVAGTYDGETKTGTFEVLMKYLTGGPSGVGFQHNYWAEFESVKVAENSVYKLKFLKVEKKLGVPDVIECECDGNEAECICGDDCDCDECGSVAIYNTANFDPEFDWAAIGISDVVNLGLWTSKTNDAKEKPMWDITDETDPPASAFADAGRGSKVVIKFGDISNSKVSYFQVALQWWDGEGGSGWAQQPGQISGGTPFPEVGGGWTWDAENHVVTVPLDADGIKIVNGTYDDDQLGICVRLNAGSEEAIDLVAIGIVIGSEDEPEPPPPPATVAEPVSPDWDTIGIGKQSWLTLSEHATVELVEEGGVAIGYTLAWIDGGSQGYDNFFPYYTIELADEVSLSDYTTVSFVLTLTAGDVQFKNFALYASSEDPADMSSPKPANNLVKLTENFSTGDIADTVDGGEPVTLTATLDIDRAAAADIEGTTIYITVWASCNNVARGNNTEYSVTNVVISQVLEDE